MVHGFPAVFTTLILGCLFGSTTLVTADDQGAPIAKPGSAKIDFRRDVAPILQQQCIDCHGPHMQLADLRLDQRRFAMGPDDARGLIQPGRSAESLLIKRLVDAKLGIIMPPSFPFFPGEKPGLAEAQINILKAWIDQGAAWPDDIILADDSANSPEDRRTRALFAAIRVGDHQAVVKLLDDKPLINSRGMYGATPLMYAATFADQRMVKLLLDQGADVDLATPDGATALMRAAGDTDKVRLLLDKTAKVNVRSEMGRTPLLVATAFPGNVATVRLLLKQGAKTDEQDVFGETCLTGPSKRGDLEMVKELVAAGADVSAGGRPPVVWAAEEGSFECVAYLLNHGAGKNKEHLNAALSAAATRGPAAAVRSLLDQGADPNAASRFGGYTPLMWAAYSENVGAETVQLLLDRGARTNVTGANGESPLSLAKKRGHNSIVDMLERTTDVKK